MNFKGKKVLITGGSIGIGLELAKRMLSEGAHVLVCARNLPALKKAKRENPSIEIVQCDVTDQKQVEALKEKTIALFGELDILVNNAAIFRRFNFLDNYSLEKQLEEIDVNLNGIVRVTNTFLETLLNKDNSTLINLTSPAAFVPLAGSPIYSATKAAINSYTTSLRHQLRNDNINIVLLCPTAIDTRMNQNNPGVEAKKLMSKEKFIDLVMKDLKKNKKEILVNPIGIFRLLSRISPRMAFNMINKDIT